MMQDATTKEQSLNYVHRFLKFQKEEPRKILRFAIILISNNRLIGECGLNYFTILLSSLPFTCEYKLKYKNLKYNFKFLY